MDDQFRPIYERLYEGYRRTSTILPRYGGETLAVAKEVSDVIEQVQSQLELDQLPILREDAKYFLLLCLVEMIYVPLREDNPQMSRFELQNDFSDDIKTIAVAASQEAKQQNEQFISTHVVVDTLHSSWDRLKSGVRQLWEKKR
jgi:hypothetical protein